MDERRLRYFLAIVEEGGVTRAATRLHVAQPSLSQALRSLERELGVELFQRVGRGLVLSDAGRALIGPARQALISLDAARDAVGEVAQTLRGTLRIAALATLAVDPLADLIGSFRRAHPGVGVQVREPESAVGASTLVRDGEAEIALSHLPAPQDGLISMDLGAQELLFVLPADGEAGGSETEDPLPASALHRIPLILSPPETSTRMLLEQALADVGVTPTVAVQTDSREAIVPLVLAGAGAALLPAPLAEQAQLRGAVMRRAKPKIVRRIGLLRRPGPLSPAARAFVEIAAASLLQFDGVRGRERLA